MKLRTEISLRPSPRKIDQHQRFFLVGSCFVEEMAARLEHIGIQTFSNPLGVLYNPLSIERCLGRVSEGCKIVREELLCKGDMWFSLSTHGSFDSPNPDEVVEEVNRSIDAAHEALGGADCLIVTLGTTGVYERDGEVVANCHKMPASEFTHRMLSLEEVIASLEKIVALAGGRRLIFTISPVRYVGYGLENNAVSKATLRLAVERVVAAHESVEYFPAYEIFMDDLRDYRYYGDDMVHPSKAGVDYVWECFVERYLTREAVADGELFARLADGRNHRPLHPESAEYATFIHSMFRKALTLSHKFPKNEIAASLVRFFAR